jgi:hypothetical protein
MKRLALVASFLLLASVQAFAQNATGPGNISYQGLWWNSPAGSQNGWGMNIAHQGGVLFATWFTYDTDGNGMWLVASDAELVNMGMDDGEPMYGYGGPGMMQQLPIYSGTLYRTTGPAAPLDAPFDKTKVTVTPVGTVVFTFTSPVDGQLTYTYNGTVGLMNITRQVFAALPDCAMGGTMPATPNFSDLWWNAPAGSESGWGVNLQQQGDILFATWFTYDATGKGEWLVMSDGEPVSGMSMTWSGALYRTTGPALGTTWDSNKVKLTQVGTATFAFSDATNGMFSATVDGKSIAKPITREVYQTPPTVCR